MGATTFIVTAKGETPRKAFDAATARARHMNGHGGYTGTIAEKTSYVVIHPPAGTEDVFKYANQLIDDEDPRIDDKWGPAGCIEKSTGVYLFFGWASE